MARVEVPQAEGLTGTLQAAALPGEFLELCVAPGHSGAIEQLPHLWDCSKCFLIKVHHRMGSADQLKSDLALSQCYWLWMRLLLCVSHLEAENKTT